jgi:hypothetical protein
MADMVVRTPGRLSIPVDAYLDPGLRRDDGRGGVQWVARFGSDIEV